MNKRLCRYPATSSPSIRELYHSPVRFPFCTALKERNRTLSWKIESEVTDCIMPFYFRLQSYYCLVHYRKKNRYHSYYISESPLKIDYYYYYNCTPLATLYVMWFCLRIYGKHETCNTIIAISCTSKIHFWVGSLIFIYSLKE